MRTVHRPPLLFVALAGMAACSPHWGDATFSGEVVALELPTGEVVSLPATEQGQAVWNDGVVGDHSESPAVAAHYDEGDTIHFTYERPSQASCKIWEYAWISGEHQVTASAQFCTDWDGWQPTCVATGDVCAGCDGTIEVLGANEEDTDAGDTGSPDGGCHLASNQFDLTFSGFGR